MFRFDSDCVSKGYNGSYKFYVQVADEVLAFHPLERALKPLGHVVWIILAYSTCGSVCKCIMIIALGECIMMEARALL